MSGECGRTPSVIHHICTKGGLLVLQCPYWMPHMYREEVEREIDLMLKESMIEPSSSEWASLVVIVKKKDDTIWLCVDYRQKGTGKFLLQKKTDTRYHSLPPWALPIQDDAIWALWSASDIFRE